MCLKVHCYWIQQNVVDDKYVKIIHSWAQQKLSPLSPLNPLNILLLSLEFNGLND